MEVGRYWGKTMVDIHYWDTRKESVDSLSNRAVVVSPLFGHSRGKAGVRASVGGSGGIVGKPMGDIQYRNTRKQAADSLSSRAVVVLPSLGTVGVKRE